MIATGIVIDIRPRRAHTLLRHSRCKVEIKWYRHELPPGVRIGSRITVLGKVMTFSNGRSFQLLDTVLLTKRPRAIAKAIAELLDGLVVEPETYLRNTGQNGDVLRHEKLELSQPEMPE